MPGVEKVESMSLQNQGVGLVREFRNPVSGGDGAADGCGAPPAAHGDGRGAPPSNTAPHSCKEKEEGLRFKVVRLAVDSLYLSYPGDLSASTVKTLLKL